jgi:hypothetical protein
MYPFLALGTLRPRKSHALFACSTSKDMSGALFRVVVIEGPMGVGAQFGMGD